MKLLLILLSLLPCALSQPPKWSTTVQLNLSAPSEELRSQIQSYIERELRTLGDVSVISAGAHFTLQAIVLNVKRPASSSVMGYTIAVVVTEPLASGARDALKAKKTDQVVENYLETINDLLHFRLYTTGTSSLRETCSEIVTDFDSGVLALRRNSWNDIVEDARKSK